MLACLLACLFACLFVCLCFCFCFVFSLFSFLRGFVLYCFVLFCFVWFGLLCATPGSSRYKPKVSQALAQSPNGIEELVCFPRERLEQRVLKKSWAIGRLAFRWVCFRSVLVASTSSGSQALHFIIQLVRVSWYVLDPLLAFLAHPWFFWQLKTAARGVLQHPLTGLAFICAQVDKEPTLDLPRVQLEHLAVCDPCCARPGPL